MTHVPGEGTEGNSSMQEFFAPCCTPNWGLGKMVHRGYSDRAPGFGGRRFMEFPWQVGRYCSYLLPKQDGGIFNIEVHPTRVHDRNSHGVIGLQITDLNRWRGPKTSWRTGDWRTGDWRRSREWLAVGTRGKGSSAGPWASYKCLLVDVPIYSITKFVSRHSVQDQEQSVSKHETPVIQSISI